MAEEVKTHEFRAEVCKVLNILTNSLYTNREIFLRELISNASDALDKLRFRINRGDQPIHGDLPLEIRVKIDKDAKTITISDTGIGMSEEELSENLGTIAKSGTEKFLQELASVQKGQSEEEKADASNIIGRFGIGFYSVFMVADSVSVTSRKAFSENGEEPAAHVWKSNGLGTYTVEAVEDASLQRGTVIVAHLKDDASEFLENYRVSSAITTHSAFVPFTIYLNDEKVNTQPALWREPKSQVKDDQYNSFYRSITYDTKDPLLVQHISVDVPVQFNAILFIPDKKEDFYFRDREVWGLDLYSRRVLIQKKNKDVIPDYLGFLKGVVDIEDLPLNISRETLQENVVLRKVQQVLVNQTLSKLEKMAKDDKEKYEHFWDLHNRIFKLSYQDFSNHERTCALMRFTSSAMPDGENGKVVLTSFDEYISRAKEGQKVIWYVTAPNREAAKLNPNMEMFRKKGIEVLYLLDPIDEILFDNLRKYKDWEFKSAEAGTFSDLQSFADVDTQTTQTAPLSNEDNDFFSKLLDLIKEVLGEKVKEVRVSQRLADSPAVLTSSDGVTSSMQRMMRSINHEISLPVRDLEINKDNEFVRNMLRIFKSNPTDPILRNMIESLFDSCVLMDDLVENPQQIAARTRSLLEKSAAWYTEIRKY